nr:MAG TPA: hypothetical protein [Caudoviricetes sp.]
MSLYFSDRYSSAISLSVIIYSTKCFLYSVSAKF